MLLWLLVDVVVVVGSVQTWSWFSCFGFRFGVVCGCLSMRLFCGFGSALWFGVVAMPIDAIVSGLIVFDCLKFLCFDGCVWFPDFRFLVCVVGFVFRFGFGGGFVNC